MVVTKEGHQCLFFCNVMSTYIINTAGISFHFISVLLYIFWQMLKHSLIRNVFDLLKVVIYEVKRN